MDKFLENTESLRGLLDSSAGLSAVVEETARLLVDVLRGGNKVLTCGNGGSAAQSSHLATELVGRYLSERRSLPAVCLSADAALLSCIVNDYDPLDLFKRQVEGLGNPGDILVGLSTSGRSENIRRAITSAGELGLKTIALLGGDGGTIKGSADLEIIVPSAETARVQEIHLLIIHTWCDAIDAAFTGGR